jgi:uncharacterized protein
VNDFAGVLSVDQKSILEEKLSLFNASTTNEIAVVTVKSLEGDYIEHYAVELFKAWGIGTKKNNNGVLLLIAVDDRKMRIEVGYGLEGSLTDSVSAQIIRDDLTPAFKQNQFYQGINQATDDIIRATKGEYVSTEVSSGDPLLFNDIIIFAGFFLMFGLSILSFGIAILGRSKSWWAGGVFGAIAGVLLTIFGVFGITFIFGSILTIMLTLIGFLFDYIVSSRYSSAIKSGSKIPWWVGGGGFSSGSSGGGFSSSSSSSSSFGGFGGGSSGGGGASGSW